MTPPTTRPPLLATLLAAFHFAPIYCQLPGQHAVGQKESYVPLIQALVDEDLSRVDELLATGDEGQLNGLDVITPLYAAQEYVRSSKQRHTCTSSNFDGTTTTSCCRARRHGVGPWHPSQPRDSKQVDSTLGAANAIEPEERYEKRLHR